MGHESLRVKSSATKLALAADPGPGTTVIVAKRNDEAATPTAEGIRAKAVREALGWSQDVLADRASVAMGRRINRTHFGNFETGANKGGGAQFLKYMRAAYGVSADAIEQMLDGSLSTDAFVRLVNEAPARSGIGPVSRVTYDDDYPNRAEAAAICEQALGDLRKIANAEGDRPLDWWLDRFAKLVRVRAEGAAKVDAIVSGGDDLFDAKPSMAPGKGGTK